MSSECWRLLPQPSRPPRARRTRTTPRNGSSKMSVSLGTAPSVWSTRRSSGRTRRRAAATGSLTHSCCTLLPTRSTPRALREHTTSYPRKPFCVTAFRRSPSRRCCKISASRSAPDPCVHRPRGWLGMGCVVCPNGSASLDPCGCRRWGGRTVREVRRGGIPCVACCQPSGERLTPSVPGDGAEP